ncbi:hypothetical protein CO2235_10172 [Cupriavidus oxalaticus]|uniref:Uncharacterized protein n=1 Tax=Cupriavidus oxalaticus TaxID=96344 RepID=A0A375FWE4_9BURK|nr:hypothetical protein CO2235_10172 [Cupriavidus oxalaticus]
MPDRRRVAFEGQGIRLVHARTWAVQPSVYATFPGHRYTPGFLPLCLACLSVYIFLSCIQIVVVGKQRPRLWKTT